MGIDTQTWIWLVIAVACTGVAWAIFWPVEPSPGFHPISTHWDLVYVDDDGVMQFTMVRVLKINPTTRRMTAWCASSGSERVFRLSKVVKATDLRSGARVNIARLIDHARAPAGRPAPAVVHDSAQADSAGSWWSTSRLGLH